MYKSRGIPAFCFKLHPRRGRVSRPACQNGRRKSIDLNPVILNEVKDLCTIIIVKSLL